MTDSLRTDLAAVLEREWRHLAGRPALIAHAHGWRLGVAAFDDLHDLLALAGYGHVRRPHPYRANVVLAGIVDAARHDELAGRIVLQRILPGLRAACRRWRHGCAPAGVMADDLLGELVAVAWSVIRSYATDRRPRNIAGNIISDTVYRAFVAPSRRMAAGEQPHDPVHFVTAPDRDRRPTAVEIVEVLAEARQSGVGEHHITLLCDLLRADGSAERVAVQRSVTSRTIRTQRARAIARVRSAALAA